VVGSSVVGRETERERKWVDRVVGLGGWLAGRQAGRQTKQAGRQAGRQASTQGYVELLLGGG